jgi:hypothetical protein
MFSPEDFYWEIFGWSLCFDFSAAGSEKASPLVKQANSCAMSRLTRGTRSARNQGRKRAAKACILDCCATKRTKRSFAKEPLLRAGRAKVEVVIHNPDFPNGKSGLTV